ncbi:hypothetical protein CsatB_029978 [Cannabis sativa]|uniref:DUF641 domain-containing protein n=1 Tax=Cannabis sativa TaxID=3483 RepID=A0A7J6FNI1_CANSA|nr:hypothetical protein G4B88_009272 [Cannabis sativa]KAF4374312.1 hypothetical protein F8388_002210 [Cannabis sativa]
MFTNIFFCSSNVERQKKKKKNASWSVRDQFETVPDDSVQYLPQTVPFYGLPLETRPKLSLRSDYNNTKSGGGIVKANKKFGGKMSKVGNLSDLIQRVTASCLLHPLTGIERRENSSDGEGKDDAEEVYEYETDEHEKEEETDEDDDQQIEGVLERRSGGSSSSSGRKQKQVWQPRTREVVVEMEMTMGQVFDAVSAMKKAYLKLQEAHCPWDPEKMRVADAAVLAEIRRLSVLRERFRRNVVVGGNGGGRSGSGRMLMAATTIKEVVAPYEAAVDELKREVKAREVEVENLKEKLKSFTVNGGGNGKKGRSFSRKKVSCSLAQVPLSTSPELFEVTTSRVTDALRTFTSLLLSLMRSAHWDIAAAVRSIELASAAESATGDASTISSSVTTQHAKYALESYVAHKMFQGFDHETFYMDGSLASLINPDQFRRDCFTQYRDMKAMDPTELLGVLPTCHFGKFCFKKYLAIVHPKMEESLFGDLEQHRQVVAGNHPRSQFYSEFLELAKTVWLLHLLAFSLDPVPSQFEASRGAEFHPQYMESVVKFPGGRVTPGQVVALPVSPGFKLWNGSVIKARVYLVPRS